jgi:SAM-dependent methyltransferases related to tRNA (uracil-5-)-methyltransferase
MSKKNDKRGATAPLLHSQVQLTVEKLSMGGNGVARHEGFVVFVQQAAPQEEVIAKITYVKKNFAEAEIVKILKPSPYRREPPCPVANVCGGCNWQHVTEEGQQLQKSLIVSETLKKFLPTVSFDFLPLQPSPRSFRYRNRIQPKFDGVNFGFFARNSHKIVPITDCPITEEALTAKFPEVKAWAQKNHRANQGDRGIQRLEMYIADNEEIRYGSITDEDDGVGFSQVNRFQNQNLIDTALEWAGDENYKSVLDLYAGAGNFTFPFAAKYSSAKVVGVELNEKLVKKAKTLVHGLSTSFFESEVEAYLRKNPPQSELIILDPPRAGCSEYSMRTLAKSNARKIIYISCHPVSLARDLKWFFDEATVTQKNWQIKRVQCFEMFPQTDHVETIVELHC